MKIIFLDIDGVLNSELFYKEKHQSERYKLEENGSDGPKGFSQIDERCVDLLNYIIDKTKSKVVVSSSWRSSRSVEELQDLLDYRGFKGEIIGKTPRLTFKSNLENYKYSVPRGCEIKAWIETNKGILGEKVSKLRYIILDDDSDMLYWQRDNYFRVDGYCGLTPNLCYRAINFLNK